MIGLALMIVGFGWALLGGISLVWGFANLGRVSDPAAASFAGGLSIMFTMLLFVLPGLVVGGIGTALFVRDRSTDEGKWRRGILGKCPQCRTYLEPGVPQCRGCGSPMNWASSR